ncbi:hypothetical protein [Nocardia sp. NPDC004711]
MLADPKTVGMTDHGLQQLCTQLASAQAAVAEQRKYLQRGGPRRKERGDHGRPLLAPADKVLITVIYLRRVCPQKVLVELLGINPNTICQVIRETRALIEERQITMSQTAHYCSHTQDLRGWLENDTATARLEVSRRLSHPELTGMTRDDFQALVDRVSIGYRAGIERRRPIINAAVTAVPAPGEGSSARRSPTPTGSWPPCWTSGNYATNRPSRNCSVSTAAPSATPSTTSCPCFNTTDSSPPHPRANSTQPLRFSISTPWTTTTHRFTTPMKL